MNDALQEFSESTDHSVLEVVLGPEVDEVILVKAPGHDDEHELAIKVVTRSEDRRIHG